MSTLPAPADTPLAEAHRLALARLRVMGMEIAEGLHAQSKEPDADLGEVATKFALVARAVRHTIALEARLAEVARRLADAALAGAGEHPTLTPFMMQTGLVRAEQRQRTAENKLEAVTLIRRAAAKVPGLDREALDEKLYERLDLDPYDKEFGPDADLSQTIAAICRDLGLDPDWGGFSSLDWRQVSLETRAALTGEAAAALPAPLYQRRPPRTLPKRSMPQPESWRTARAAREAPS